MVVGQLLITPTIGICIQQLGCVEEMITICCDTEYLAYTEPLCRAGLSVAVETLVYNMSFQLMCQFNVNVVC